MYSTSGLSEERAVYLYKELRDQLAPQITKTKRKRDELTGGTKKRGKRRRHVTKKARRSRARRSRARRSRRVARRSRRVARRSRRVARRSRRSRAD